MFKQIAALLVACAINNVLLPTHIEENPNNILNTQYVSHDFVKAKEAKKTKEDKHLELLKKGVYTLSEYLHKSNEAAALQVILIKDKDGKVHIKINVIVKQKEEKKEKKKKKKVKKKKYFKTKAPVILDKARVGEEI